MNNSTKTRLENKYDVSIFNVQNLSGFYKLSMTVMIDNGNYKDIVVKSNQTISNAIENFIYN